MRIPQIPQKRMPYVFDAFPNIKRNSPHWNCENNSAKNKSTKGFSCVLVMRPSAFRMHGSLALSRLPNAQFGNRIIRGQFLFRQLYRGLLSVRTHPKGGTGKQRKQTAPAQIAVKSGQRRRTRPTKRPAA